MSTGGKGSRPRPYSIPLKQFDNNWDAIFGKKDKDIKEVKNKDDEQLTNTKSRPGTDQQ